MVMVFSLFIRSVALIRTKYYSLYSESPTDGLPLRLIAGLLSITMPIGNLLISVLQRKRYCTRDASSTRGDVVRRVTLMGQVLSPKTVVQITRGSTPSRSKRPWVHGVP